MVKAREFVRSKGGPLKARILTKFQLALLGELSWEACPALPIQFILMPGVTPGPIGKETRVSPVQVGRISFRGRDRRRGRVLAPG